MKLFVTGATGFIGSHFIQQSLDVGHQVIALRRSLVSKSRIFLKAEPKWLEKQLDHILIDDLRGVDVLVHLAAHTPNVPYDTLENCIFWNVLVPLQLFEKAREAGVKQFVVAGSCFEYGRIAEQYQEGVPAHAALEPLQTYPASKAASSIAFRQWAVEKRQRLSYHRIFQVFGEGESESRLWPSLKKAAKAGEDFPMTLGEQIRDFIPVEEVAKRLLDACFEDLEEGVPVIKNLGSGNPQSIRQFAQYWWNFWQAKGELQIGALPYRDHEVFHFTAKD